MTIKGIKPRKILSSMGSDTVSVTLSFDNAPDVSVGVPAGLSAGKYEAVKVEVDEAINQINSVSGEIIGHDWDQKKLDELLVDKKLASNASLPISAAFFKSTLEKEASYENFPKLLTLLFEGGKHGNPNLSIQEFLLIEDSLEQAIGDFKKMRSYLWEQKMETTVGAEGGFSPAGVNDSQVLDIIKKVFPENRIALDVAGSFNEDSQELENILPGYNIFSIEDPYSDEEWEKWESFYEKYGMKKMVVGDDLTVTNPERIEKAASQKAINAVIIKPNQNGTITGTLKAAFVARMHNLKVIVSHRGEETNDDWIVDLALILKADYVKFGGINRGERIAKYNRLLKLGMK